MRVIPTFEGNPAIRAYTPPYPTTVTDPLTGLHLDGGFSNTKYFFSADVTVTAINISKKYGEILSAPAAEIKVDGVLLQNTNPLLTLQDIGLDNMTLTTAATSKSDVGTYIITPSRTFDQTNAADVALLKKYSYKFNDGTVTIAKMPLKVTPDNKTVPYGQNIGKVTFKYEFNTANVNNADSMANDIKTYHEGLLPNNALAVVKDFKKQQVNGVNAFQYGSY